MKYTKADIKAIQQSADMWKWLADNPRCHKMDYPLYEKEIEYKEQDCPCCHKFLSANNFVFNTCGKCPLKDDPTEIRENGDFCCKEFYLWLNGKSRKKNATIIFEKLNKVLEEYKNKGNK